MWHRDLCRHEVSVASWHNPAPATGHAPLASQKILHPQAEVAVVRDVDREVVGGAEGGQGDLQQVARSARVFRVRDAGYFLLRNKTKQNKNWVPRDNVNLIHSGSKHIKG